MPSVSQATPSIAFSGATVIATAEQQAGYVAGGVTSATLSIQENEVPRPTFGESRIYSAGGYWYYGISAFTTLESGFYKSGSKAMAHNIPAIREQQRITPKATMQTLSGSHYYLYPITIYPIPSTYIQPNGTSEITANGVYDVRAFESASVNVEGYLIDDIATKKYNSYIIGESTSFIASYAFMNCPIIVAEFPVTSIIYTQAFYMCEDLTTVIFPEAETIGTYGFGNCSNLINTSFPRVQSIEDQAFAKCTELSALSLPSLQTIGNAFNSCVKLISVDLRNVSSVPSMTRPNIFSTTPIGGNSSIAGQLGSIYVPSSLYNLFVTTTNWSKYSDRMISV